MDPTPSLSQGVFIDRPKGNKHKVDRLTAKCFGAFDLPQETIEFRRSLYKTYLNKVKESLSILEKKWNTFVTKQVAEFIMQATASVANNEMVTPIGFVPTGFCAEETTALFNSVEDDLQSAPQTPFIARVSSTKCPTVKLGFQNICKQLLQNNSNASCFYDKSAIEDLEDTLMDESSAGASKNSRYISIHDLQKWYQSKCSTYFENPLVGDSPSLRELRTPKRLGNRLHDKLIRKDKNTQGIVIILENADYFPNNIVSQLLKVLSSAKLPVIFLLGVNQCLADFNRFLPRSSSTTFIHKTFKAYSTDFRLNEAMNTVLLDPDVPFKLSPSIVRFLKSYMINQHFSIPRFLQSYQICILDHFRTPESVFCTCNAEKSKWTLDILKASFNSLTTSQYSRKGKPLNTLSNYHDRIDDSYKEFQQWLLMLHILHATENHLSNSPVTFAELYVACGSGEYFESLDESVSRWERTFTRIQKLRKVGVENLLDEVYDYGEKVYIANDLKRTNRNQPGVEKDIEAFIAQLYDFGKKLKELESDISSGIKNPASPINKSPRLQAKMTKEDLKKTLLESIAKNNEESPKFAAFKAEFCDFFHKQVKKILKPLKNLQNSKIFVYENLQMIKSLLSPSPELLISHNLKMPGKILNCVCCKDTPDHSVHENLPDVSIVYKILMEQVSKKVNLNIIYQSFSSIIETDHVAANKSRKSTGKTKNHDSTDIYLIRFRQAVAELQHVGVLKRSKTKPDEVTKLVWHM